MTTPFIMEFNSHKDSFDQKYVDDLKNLLYVKLGIKEIGEREMLRFIIEERNYKKACEKTFLSLCYIKAMAFALEKYVDDKYKTGTKYSVNEKTQEICWNGRVIRTYDDYRNSIAG
ncbi:hypothetical protein OFO01_07095 [Campylobacter sp. JMF_01 NE2]|uniref:hypothetical protein n=1 Tax=unclassified Campylobacter TaxID=2593542 RepID=UPI0022EA07F9|nr:MULTISPECIES: hypothetical protein [unclassified Campylobacter]MDA3053271.1 hypothetical protein [Campylobacter sp. JMF_03 NE3]MDA3067546.1 hypothetical protein [Campylobacter sp. JMF_01 NE2]